MWPARSSDRSLLPTLWSHFSLTNIPFLRVNMPRFSGFVILLILAAVLSRCSFSLAGDITPPPGSELPAPQDTAQAVVTSPVYPIVPPDLANGKNLYNQECIQC